MQTTIERHWARVHELLGQIAASCDLARTRVRLHHEGSIKDRILIQGDLEEIRAYADGAFESLCRIGDCYADHEPEHVSEEDVVPDEDFFPPPGGTPPQEANGHAIV